MSRSFVDIARDRLREIRSSLFFIPALFIAGALLLARVLTWIDGHVDLEGVPIVIGSTAAGARALLGTAAGATITVAGIVFSVTVVSVQLASSQFSPRVLQGFLRDRFKQNVIGLVVGTFTYCLVVLAVTRGTEGRARLAVTVALALAVLSILAIVAFIDQSARSMQVGEVVRRIADETLHHIRRAHPERGTLPAVEAREAPMPPGEGYTVRAPDDGWVQEVDADALLRALPPDGVMRLDTRVGAFMAAQMPLATIWPEPKREGIERPVRRAVKLGRTRTLLQDEAFGVRQLVDIALRALSPGVNDPTTANEVLVHLAGIVREVMVRDLPPRVVAGEEGRRLFLPHNLDRPAFVRAAFAEIRVAAMNQPAVLGTLVRVLAGLNHLLAGLDLEERARPLRREARLVVEGLASTELLEEDLAKVLERARDLAGEEESAPDA